jgi:hypothetical protein
MNFLPAALLVLTSVSPAVNPVNYAGQWQIRAVSDDGSVADQSVTLTQSLRKGRIYLSGYGLSGPLTAGVGSVYTVSKGSDAVRTFSAVLRFTGRTLNGSGQLREVYTSGEKVVTRFKITGQKK